MSLAEIILTFSDMSKTKKASIYHIQRIFQAISELQFTGTLIQRISFISTMASFIRKVTDSQLTTVEKLKQDVLYGVLLAISDKQKRVEATKKRTHHRRTDKRTKELTMNEILEEVMAEGLNQSQNVVQPSLPKQDLADVPSKDSVTIPPLEGDIITKLNQSQTAMKVAEKQSEIAEWQPSKLSEYKKWLALTQDGIEIIKPERPPKTKKKNMPKNEVITDDKIVLSQGVSQIAWREMLQTKIKVSRQYYESRERSFQSLLSSLHPSLTNLEELKSKLIPKALSLRKTPTQSQNPEIPETSFQITHLESPKRSIFVDSGIRPDQLINRLRIFLDSRLPTERKISFSRICGSVELHGASKGEIFHALLHLQVGLYQQNVAQFGEIQVLSSVS